MKVLGGVEHRVREGERREGRKEEEQGGNCGGD